MRALGLLFALLLGLAAPAQAWTINPGSDCPVLGFKDGQGFYCSTPATLGSFTRATLPAASTAQGKYAYVTDLGGGPGVLISDGTCWTRVRDGSVVDVPLAANVTIDYLATSNVINLTGSGITGNTNVTVTNSCASAQMQIIQPSNLLNAVTGTIGISMAGLSLPLAVNGPSTRVQYTGSKLVILMKGTN